MKLQRGENDSIFKEETGSSSWNTIAGNICNNSGAARKNRSRCGGLRGVQVWPAEINSPPCLSDSLCCKSNRQMTRPSPLSRRTHSPSSRLAHQGKESLRAVGSLADLSHAQKESHQHLGGKRGRGHQSDWCPLSSLHNCSLPAPFALQVILTDEVPGWYEAPLPPPPLLLVTWYFISLLDHLCNWNWLTVLLIVGPEPVVYFKFNSSFIAQFSIILSASQRLSLSMSGAADPSWKTNRGPVLFVFHDKCCRPQKLWKSLQGS